MKARNASQVAWVLGLAMAGLARGELVHRYGFNGTVEDSVGGQHGTLVNHTGSAHFAGGQVVLGNDGSQTSGANNGDYIDLPNGLISSLGNQATLEIWTTWSGPGSLFWQRIFDFGTSDGGEGVSGSTTNSSYIYLSPASDDRGELTFGHRNGVQHIEQRISGTDVIMTEGQQQHVVISWDGAANLVSMYLDGQLIVSDAPFLALSQIVDQNNWLGRSQRDDILYTGSYNEFRIWDHAMTADEAEESYVAGPDASYLAFSYDPQPADGATELVTSQTLSWSKTDHPLTTGQILYWGTDEAAVTNATPASLDVHVENLLATATEFVLPTLDEGTTYYWRVDEVSQPAPQTLLGPESTQWHYRKGTNALGEPSASWKAETYVEDGSWQAGQTSIGYGDNDDHTVLSDMRNNYSTIYLRHTLPIAGPDDIPSALQLKVYVDDGCIVWINGTELSQRFYCSSGFKAYNALTGAPDHEATGWDTLDIPGAPGLLHTGTNVIAIHALNQTLNSSDFSIDAQLRSIFQSFSVKGNTWRFTTRTGAAGSPFPANGAMGQPLGLTLSWASSSAVTGHRVYLGTAPNDLALVADNLADRSYHPGNLVYGTQYFWRVNCVYADQPEVTGAVWAFQTKAASPACLPGDLNSDCRVDLADLAIFVQQWLRNDTCEGPDCADINYDLNVDLRDYAYLSWNWMTKKSSRVVINEIHYHPAENTKPTEFIELYNADTGIADLGNWYFSDGITYVFPPGAQMDPGEYLVLAQDPSYILSEFGVAAFGQYQGSLSNSGERVQLSDAQGQIVDEVDYGSDFPWPAAAGGEGASMELINPDLDNDLGGSWRSSGYQNVQYPAQAFGLPTPGRVNSVLSYNVPPQVRQVDHVPQQPTSSDSVHITAKVTDPNGVASVALQYWVVPPGQYVPAFSALPIDQLKALTTTTPVFPANATYFNEATWTTTPMYDDGTHGDVLAGDSIYTVVLPAQPQRSLVRYRILVEDGLGHGVRVPYADDESMNFAYFVYNGVPAYQGTPAEVMANTLPVYHLITIYDDYLTCLAYRVADRLVKGSNAWFVENWPGAMVYEGKVYDNIRYRLRGSNGRYGSNTNFFNAKRSMVFRFNRGNYFQARNAQGEKFQEKWRTLTTYKGHENRRTQTYSLNEIMNFHLWNLAGVPAPYSYHYQWRVITTAQEQPDLYTGDFQGIYMVGETYDGRFLDEHDLPEGNLYKLVASGGTGASQELRYQGPYAVTDFTDHANITTTLGSNKNDTFVSNHVSLDEWIAYQAIGWAVKNFDGTATEDPRNAAWYFEPNYLPENHYFGRLWLMPWDTDGTWGPYWSDLPDDRVYGAVFIDSSVTNAIKVPYFNKIREVYDLVWQRDQVEPLIHYYADKMQPLIAADRVRWENGFPALDIRGTYSGLISCPGRSYGLYGPDWPNPPTSISREGYADDMVRFAFLGGKTWPGDSNTTPWKDVLLSVCDGTRTPGQNEGAYIPNTPTATYIGATGFPENDLRFECSVFSDPQGGATFAARKWRIAEISDPNNPLLDPNEPPALEIQAKWESGEITDPANRTVLIPYDHVKPGHTYRVRVRQKDKDPSNPSWNRWSHWSAPIQFIAGAALSDPLLTDLRVTEIMYHPADPNAGSPYVDEDFEFIELRNIGTSTLDLSHVSFTNGITFSFAGSSVNQLSPGQYVLVVKNLAAFTSRYGTAHVGRVAGTYPDNLANDGEEIKLEDAVKGVILEFDYSDGWYPITDGLGYSLTVVNAAADAATYGIKANWRPSGVLNGTPAQDDTSSAPAPGSILINEVLAHAHAEAPDWIELFNTTSQAIPLGGWFLSDSLSDLKKYEIPSDVYLPGNGYVVLYENETFGTAFGLSENGDQVYLNSGDGEELTGFSVDQDFGASETGVAFGRHLKSTGGTDFVAMSSNTPEVANAYPKVGPIVISEIMYNPKTNADAEYVELHNISGTSVNLWEYDALRQENVSWRFVDSDSSITCDVPVGTTLGAGQKLLLVRNMTAFLTEFGSPPGGVTVVVWGSGKLDNAGEKIELLKPGDYADGRRYYIRMDRVNYSDGSHPVGGDPWPTGPDGTGQALLRKVLANYGNDVANWQGASPSPGQ